MTKKVTTTEEFAPDGTLIKRTVTTEEDDTQPAVKPWVTPYYPSPQPWSGTGGCSACALSGVCNCVRPDNQIFCETGQGGPRSL